MKNNNFKQTEIGLIPKDWEVVRMGEVLFEVPIKTRQTKIEPDKYYKRIFTKLYGKGVELKDVVRGKQISCKIMFIVEKNDFIFSKINIRKGAYGVITDELAGAFVTTEHPILKAKQEMLDIMFFSFYLLQPSTWERIKLHAKGFSGKERVKLREFLSIIIPLPPLPEQKNIAYVLSTIQEAIEKTDAIIKATKELKKSLMKHLFTYGPVSINETEKVKLKQTEIGFIPEDWEVVRLGEVFNIFAGGDVKKLNFSPFKNEKYIYPIFSNSLENDGLYGFADTFNFPENSITVTGRGNLGYAIPRYCKFNAIIRLLVLVPKKSESINIKFISEYINGFIRVSIEGSSIPQLTKPKISMYITPLPPFPVQQKIAEILSAVDEKIQAEENKKKALQELFKSMLHNLMSGKIRVNHLKEVSYG